MKKSIILTGAIALALGFQSCQKGDNGAQAAKDWASIDSISNLRATAFTDSLNNTCMMAAKAKGMAMGDSMVTASKKGGKKTNPKVTPPTPVKVEPKKEGGKLGDKLGTQDGKLKDKLNPNDANKNQSGGKLKDKLPK